ncbi:amino acid aminotransferase [Shewanella xiamenensis]|uniref:amino acid aminotransferase n=1 Tax=Shewanella xiamenensis TaxID=332186 RepID=UPI0024A6A63F|nr:amino acid aminotransferase [Shewanella xiamenensis]MDI5837741.1 aspartate/tyrosine/aromatic aminotransferase [Shewanella xiamenensis]MDI5841724.1 aspartate/tyrosine/aromatic aminotransferase [Shewanella xiamenensis]MDI5845608.1 aspartate/tyrosine/aromatic aminotransferase [Shewanella xiamenensis]MDI5849768.1 aspartate/tyrosine/aromatic aminotransferase [Shewanella xiamenensis]MDI5853520.1 aspartate/tyrosine/aromatic aminotransferase [Shewanella xiamenensis]
MFNSLIAMPADPILGLLTQYREDTHPQKVDLGVGVYKDPAGNTPILNCVKKAEKFRLETETTKVYIGPTGSPQFNTLMTQLAFGSDHSAIIANRIRTVSTPGGTGALRVAGDFIKRCNPNAVLWVSDPTWANHTGLFEAAGITVKTYPYYDYDSKSLKFEEMLAALSQVSPDDVVLLHACCHNPSGMDLTTDQWDKVVTLTKEQGFTPLIDMAYQGFGDGVDIDAYGVRKMAAAVDNMILCSSCSKNFGLYRERIGSCSVIAKDANTANIAQSVLLYVVRCLYSMPPAHGAAIVETILGSKELTQEWLDELKVMRDRINGNRAILVEKLKANGVERDFSFIARQKGMFSFLGVNPEQVARLQKEFSIYMVGSSRISIAGISEDNVDYLAMSIAKVL